MPILPLFLICSQPRPKAADSAAKHKLLVKDFLLLSSTVCAKGRGQIRRVDLNERLSQFDVNEAWRECRIMRI